MVPRPLLFLAVYTLALLALGARFIALDAGSWDSDTHYAISLAHLDPERYRAVFALGEESDPTRGAYPPLLYRATVPLHTAMGPSQASARLAVLAFLPVWVLALYGLGRTFGGTWGGLATVGLGTASPAVVEVARRYFLDFPQVALTAAALAFLLSSDGLRRRNPSLLFGVAAAAACLVKWSSGLWLAFPVAWEGAPALVGARGRGLVPFLLLAAAGAGAAAWLAGLPAHGEPHPWLGPWLLVMGLPCLAALALARPAEGRPAANLAAALAVAALLASPWYFQAGSALKARWLVEMDYPRSPAANAAAMATFLLQVFPLWPVFLGPGIALALRDPRRRSLLGLLAATAAAFLVLWRVGHPVLRYDLTFAAFLAPLGGWWAGRGRPAVAGAALLLGLLSWSWGVLLDAPDPVAPATRTFTSLQPRLPGLLAPPPPNGRADDLDALVGLLPASLPPGSLFLSIDTRQAAGGGLSPEQLVDAAFRHRRALGFLVPMSADSSGRAEGNVAGRLTGLEDLPADRVAGALILHGDSPPVLVTDRLPMLRTLRTLTLAPGRRVTVARP